MKINKTWRLILTILAIPILFLFSILIFWVGLIAYWTIKYPDPVCTNSNIIFENNLPESNQHKAELSRLLQATTDLETDFWFNKYVDTNHISIFIQNDCICTHGIITINKDHLKNDGGFMNHLMKVKGVSYGGPLIGMEFAFSEDPDQPEIFLTAVEDIID